MKRKTLVLGIALVVIVAAVAVASYYFLQPPPEEEQVLIWGTTEDLFAVFPALSRTYSTYIPCSSIFETLLGFKPGTAELVPRLATAWRSIDPTIWEFDLREGVKFHDGTTFDAAAVKFSLERTLDDPDRPWGAGQLGKYIDHVEIIDDYKVRIHLKPPGHAGFPRLVAFPVTGIYSKKAYEDAGEDFATEGAVGTGPFKFVSWTPEETVLEVNEDYWDPERMPKVDKVIFREFADSASLKLALETGEIDIAHRWMFPADVPSLMNNPDIVTKVGPDPYAYMLCLHNNMSYTDDVRIRYAIAYSIDYDAIEQILPSERAFSVMPPTWPEASDVQQMFERNVTKAKELLEEAGYPDGLPEKIEMYWTPDFGPAFGEIAVLIQSNLAEAGIPIKLNAAEWTTMLQYRKESSMHMALVRFTYTFADPDYMCMFTMWSGGSYPNGFGYGYQEIDDLMDLAAVETDETTRISIYKDIQEIFDSKTHLIYIFRGQTYLFHRKNISGANIDAAIFYNIASYLTEIEKH